MADKCDLSSLITFQKVVQILAKNLRNLLEEKIQCLLIGGQISSSYSYMDKTLKEELKDIPDLQIISSVKNINEAAFYGIFRAFNNPIFA